MSQPTYTPITIRHLILHLKKAALRIIGLSIAIGMIAAMVTLTLDNEYRSTANLLPAQQRAAGLESLIGGRLGNLAGSIVGGGRSTVFDRYLILLNSETTKRSVVETFNLIEVYETGDKKYPMESAIRRLNANTQFLSMVEGNFLIHVWDTDPVRARDMARHYVRLLNDFNNEISTREARDYRLFIESRYNQSMFELDSLRNRMVQFQEANGIYELGEQVKLYLSLIGQLSAEKIQLEARLMYLEMALGKDSPSYQQTQTELSAITRKLNEVMHSNDPNPLLMNIDAVPGLGSEYLEIMQKIEVQSEILKVIVPMFEQSKFEEAKALNIVSIVDEPRVPERKDRPFRALIVLFSMASGFVMMALMSILYLYYRQNRDFLRHYFVR